MKNLTNDELDKLLTKEFGFMSQWPVIRPTPPSWFDRLERRTERHICHIFDIPEITLEMRARYWEQVYEGQGYDDAGGYKLRCWRAMLGMPFLPAWTSYSAIMDDEELSKTYGVKSREK